MTFDRGRHGYCHGGPGHFFSRQAPGIPLTHRPIGWDAADPIAEPAWGHASGGLACGRTGTFSFHPLTKDDAYGVSMR